MAENSGLLRTTYKLLRSAVLLGRGHLICTLYGQMDLAVAIFGNRTYANSLPLEAGRQIKICGAAENSIQDLPIAAKAVQAFARYRSPGKEVTF
jgi:hypothetical protein